MVLITKNKDYNRNKDLLSQRGIHHVEQHSLWELELGWLKGGSFWTQQRCNYNHNLIIHHVSQGGNRRDGCETWLLGSRTMTQALLGEVVGIGNGDTRYLQWRRLELGGTESFCLADAFFVGMVGSSVSVRWSGSSLSSWMTLRGGWRAVWLRVVLGVSMLSCGVIAAVNAQWVPIHLKVHPRTFLFGRCRVCKINQSVGSMS